MTKQEVEEQVEAFKLLFATLKNEKQSRPTRGKKYEKGVKDFMAAKVPLMKLDDRIFSNDSESSLNQQFKKAQEDLGVSGISCVVTDAGKFLIDFDDERAEQAFANVVEKITSKELTFLSNELVAAIK